MTNTSRNWGDCGWYMTPRHVSEGHVGQPLPFTQKCNCSLSTIITLNILHHYYSWE